MKTILAAALLFAAGLAAAQDAGVRDAAVDERRAERARLREMSQQERAEFKAVASDKSKSAVELKAEIKGVRMKYREKRRALRGQTRQGRRGSAPPQTK